MLRTNILKVRRGFSPKNGGASGGWVGHPALCAALAAIGREFYGRGWVLGTSGNFSAVLSRQPLRVAITHSGVDKGRLSARQIVRVDADGKTVEGRDRPSDETQLHLMLVRLFHAGAVLHTHSIWGTIASDAYAAEGGVGIEGYEMLKGLAGVRTHEHREWLPIIKNLQDMAALTRVVQETLEESTDPHGFLLRRHGLYTWGRDLGEAKRHTEILEFLLEVLGRRQGSAGSQPEKLQRS